MSTEASGVITELDENEIPQNVEEFIEHFGVKGMKWGVRKARNRVKLSSDYRQTVPLRNRNTKELSNKQIQKVNARINMEQNYRRLNPNKVQAGEAMIKTVMATVGTLASVYTFLQTPAGKAAVNLVKKKGPRQLKLPGM